MVVSGNGGFVPCIKKDVDENGEEDEFVRHAKPRLLVLRKPKTTKMTKVAGVPQTKPWFTDSGVLKTLKNT